MHNSDDKSKVWKRKDPKHSASCVIMVLYSYQWLLTDDVAAQGNRTVMLRCSKVQEFVSLFYDASLVGISFGPTIMIMGSD